MKQGRIQDFSGGGANPDGGGEGRQPIIRLNFPENCIKMKKKWTGRGGSKTLQSRSATVKGSSEMNTKLN